MPLWLIVLLVIVVGAVVWTFRRRIFKGRVFAHDLTASDFADGKFPPEFYQASSDMQHKVSDAVSRYYLKVPPKDTQPELLPFYGKPYTYVVPLEKLVNQVEIVDSFPDGAAADIHRAGPGAPIIMGVTKHALQQPDKIQHELAHALSWDRPELWEQCKRSPRNHWPVMFDVIGSYA